MTCPIRNRGFNKPLDATDGDTPQKWTRESENTPSWGGADWQSGIWRAFQGGPYPKRGRRCLLLGADDAAAATVSTTLADADESIFSQDVAGAALANASHIEAHITCCDAGFDSSNSEVKLEAYDGSTTVTDNKSLDTMTLFADTLFAVALATLNSALTYTLRAGLYRTAASSSGNRAIPRCYVDDIRCRWSPYKGPLRVMRYSDDLAPDGTVESSTTAASGYANTNAINREAAIPFLTGTESSGHIEIDLGADNDISMVALVDCNLVAGETWVVKLATAAEGADASGEAITATFPTNVSNNSYVEFAVESARYVRIEFTKASGASDKAFQIGEVVIGHPRHMQQNYEWGADTRHHYDGINHRTPYNVAQNYARSSGRMFSLGFGILQEEDAWDLLDVIDDAHGSTYPVLLVPDPSSYECFYGYFGPDHSVIETFINLQRPGRLTFEEQADALVQT